MASYLEALVAKGRRALHPREQREVAYALADLSSKPNFHEPLVTKGGVKTIVGLLTQTRDEEAQRFAAIAVANISTADLYRLQVARESNALELIIGFLNNGDADGNGRQYCAMAVGNLAADAENHESIAKLGGIKALVTLLAAAAKEQNTEIGRYVAFALSNLAASANHRKEIVDRGAIEPLIAFACSDDFDARRHSLAALRGICISRQYRVMVVRLGILDPLILMARSRPSDTADLQRGVASALSCLSCVDEIKEEVADRAISTIISLSLSNDAVVEQHACCAIASLVEVMDVHDPFLQARGVPAVVAMSKSSNIKCKAEACRALANLAANAEVQQQLAKEGVIGSMIDALGEENDVCQKYSALCIANLATTIGGQIEIVQGGAIKPLILLLVKSTPNHADARKYAALAMGNLTAMHANHAAIIESDGLEAMLTLSNSSDVLSLYYLGFFLANLGSAASNHGKMAEMGCIQPSIALAHSKDPDVQQRAAATLRGLSVTDDVRQKIVQEGGLEPLTRMLLSKNVDILRDVTACLCNLSLGEKTKSEIANCGAVSPLLAHMQSEDMLIACQSSACLANLAGVSINQDLIAQDGGILPCISAMRSRYLEVQRASGRLLATLCACTVPGHIIAIMDGDGHGMLLSFLLCDDVDCQRVGVFGLGNLCSHDTHHVTLMKMGLFEPLAALAQSELTGLEIRRLAIMAIANLSSTIENHVDLVADGVLPMLITLSNSSDADIRHFSAFAVSRIATNPAMRRAVTDEGGLEPVLYLARTDDQAVQRALLPAITSLSFVDANKIDICNNGGLPALVADISSHENSEGADRSRLACCGIGNLAEIIENMPLIVDSNAIPLLVVALSAPSSSIQREAARSLGNLAANIVYGALIIKCDALSKLVKCFRRQEVECKRMAAFAIGNLASNVKFHDDILKEHILDAAYEVLRDFLDPKYQSDADTTRFTLLMLANLFLKEDNHSVLCERYLDVIIAYGRCGDIKCRHYALFVLGNICRDAQSIPTITSSGGIKSLVSLSYPRSSVLESTNVQFQAMAGLRGLATTDASRKEVVCQGGLEPLILAASATSTSSSSGEGFDVDVQREAACVICNLTLSSDSKLTMCQQGIIPALINLIASGDPVNQLYSAAALANLADVGGIVLQRFLEGGIIGALLELVDTAVTPPNVRAQVSRCLANMACFPQSHDVLASTSCLRRIIHLASAADTTNNGGDDSGDERLQLVLCRRYAALAVACLSHIPSNHSLLIQAGVIRSILPLSTSSDRDTCRCAACTLHCIAVDKENHSKLSQVIGYIQAVVALLHVEDVDTSLRACLATKLICVSSWARTRFVEVGGITPLLKLCDSDVDDFELKREACAALRNVSLSSENRVNIVKDGGLGLLSVMCRSSDNDTSHQACGILANLAETPSNREIMLRVEGIVQHLKAALRSDGVDTRREAVRTIANLSSEIVYTTEIAGSGVIISLIEELSSSDAHSQKLAALAVSNLAAHEKNQERIVLEGGVEPLFALLTHTSVHNDEVEELITRRYALSAIANLAACHSCHGKLMEAELLARASSLLNSRDCSIRSSAVLCVANLASNRLNHDAISDYTQHCPNSLLSLTKTPDGEIRLLAVKALRGIAANERIREALVDQNALEIILELCPVGRTDDNDSIAENDELQTEVLALICNLSKGGHLGSFPERLLESADGARGLVSLLRSDNTTHILYGAVALGNIAVDTGLHEVLIEADAIATLLDTARAKKSSQETKRGISYALCNLSAHPANCQAIVKGGGLDLIVSLCRSGDVKALTSGLATIRSIAENPRHRRKLVLSGALDAISLGLKCSPQKRLPAACLWEACTAMYSLSLNEQNKVSIVDLGTTTALKDAVALLLPDSSPGGKSTSLPVLRQVTRIVANCCENETLVNTVSSLLDIDKCLLGLLKLGDVELSREVTRLIANMASCVSTHRDVLSSAIPERIVRLCKSTDGWTRQYGLVAVLNLVLASIGGQLRLVEAGASKLIIDIIDELTIRMQGAKEKNAVPQSNRCQDLQCLHYSCLVLGTLATHPKYHKRLHRDGVVPAISKALGLGNVDVHVCAGFVFNLLARSQNNACISSLSGATSTMVKVVKTAETRGITQSLVALRFLGRHDALQLAIIENGGLDALSRASGLHLGGFSTSIRREIAGCMCALTQHSKYTLASNSAVLDIVLKLAHSTDAEVARFGLAALANVAEDPSTHHTKDKGVLPFLIRLMKENSITTKPIARCREATRAASNLLSTSQCHEQFLGLEGLSALNVVAQGQDKECIYAASLAYRKLAAHASNQARIMETSMHVIIAKLQSECEIRTQLQAANATKEIASNEFLKLQCVGNGVLKSATALLLRSDDVIPYARGESDASSIILKAACAEILRHLSISSRIKALMLQQNVTGLFSCMESSNDVLLLSQCGPTIANLVENKKNRVDMIKLGVIKTLATVLTSNKNTVACIQEDVGRAMCSLSYEDVNHAAMLEDSCCKSVLLDLLTCGSNPAATFASLAIGNLAVTPQGQLLMGEAGVVTPLVKLLSSPSLPACQKAASRALSRLAASDETKSKIVDAGALPKLKRQLTHTHDDEETRHLASMLLCNLLCDTMHHNAAVSAGFLAHLAEMLNSSTVLGRRYSAASIYNLSLSSCHHATIMKQSGALSSLVNLIAENGGDYGDKDSIGDGDALSMEYAMMTLGRMQHAINSLADTRSPAIQRVVAATSSHILGIKRAASLAVYSVSTSERCHSPLVSAGAPAVLFTLCDNQDVIVRRLAIMTMCNLSANPSTRADVTRAGGLQVVIRLIGDDDRACRDYACICAANICNSVKTQEQVVVHGSLPHLKRHALSGSIPATMSLANIFTNHGNHETIMKEDGVFETLVTLARSPEARVRDFCAYAIANLTSTNVPETLYRIVHEGGMGLLIDLATGNTSAGSTPHGKCLAITAVKRLASLPENRHGLIESGILSILSSEGRSSEIDIQREVAACLFELTLSTSIRHTVVDACCSELLMLLTSKDIKTAASSAGALANTAEETDLHGTLKDAGAPTLLSRIILQNTSVHVIREATRATSNIVSTKSCQDECIQCGGLVGLFNVALTITDKECDHHIARALSMLSCNAKSHLFIVKDGLTAVHLLMQSMETVTCSNAATSLRNTCANCKYNSGIVKQGSISELINLSRRDNLELKQLAMESLDHLSTTTDEKVRRAIIESDNLLVAAIQCISTCTTNAPLHRTVASLFANLSECHKRRECLAKLVSGGIVPALIVLSRGQASCSETQMNCALSLVNLCSSEQVQVYRQGGLDCLLDVLVGDHNRHVAIGLRLLASNPKVCKAISTNENILTQVIFMAKHSFLDYQRSASSILGSLTLNSDFQSLIARKDGSLEEVVGLLSHADLRVQRNATYAVANVAESSALRPYLIRYNAVQALGTMDLVNNDVRTTRNLSRALSSLSFDSEAQTIMLRESNLVSRVVRLSRSADSNAQRYGALSLCNLCREQGKAVLDVSTTGASAFKGLILLSKFPDPEVMHLAAAAFAALALGCDDNRSKLVEEGAVKALLNLLTFPDEAITSCALLAINSIIIGGGIGSKEALTKEGGIIESFISLFKTSSNSDIIFGAVYALGTILEDDALGEVVAPFIDDIILSIFDKIGSGSLDIKRAGGYLVSLLLSGGKNYDRIEMVGGIGRIVNLASMSDNECQEYGAFCLAELAKNDALKVDLVRKYTAVPSLVAIMSGPSIAKESKRYAAMALLSIAEDYETHLVLGEAGAIGALLSMSAEGELQYRVSKTSARVAESMISS